MTGTSASSNKNYMESLKFICDHMIETRPKAPVIYRPYINTSFASRHTKRNVRIELDEFYKTAKVGDRAFVYVNLLVQCDTRLMITVKGAKRVFINNVEHSIDTEKAKTQYQQYALCEVHVNNGDNELVFECEKTEDGFYLDYIIGHIYWPHSWTCDYLLWTRDTIPVNEFYGEQGFALSELIKSSDCKSYSNCRVIFPTPAKSDVTIDFNRIYGNESGDFAAAYTVATADGKLNIVSANEICVYVNEKPSSDCVVKGGDSIFVICKRGKDGWSIESLSNDIIGLPFVKSNRDIHWITIGAFSDAGCPKFSLTEPYKNADGADTFWRFAEENTYLRPYLDTSFYGQWFYGLMVGEYGILRTSEHYPEFYDYFYDSMRKLVDYFDLMNYEARMFGDSAFLKRGTKLFDLDSIGTIGMNLCELYERESDKVVKDRIFHVLTKLSEAVYSNIPRMDDGTFYRIETMWADDTFMSCPFLVRMGNITDDNKYYEEVVSQLKLYTEKLYMDDANVFSHIYFPKLKRANRVPWGRGNGWVYWTFMEVIGRLPRDYPGRDELIDIFKKAVCGVCKLQSESGLWHQVLNMPSSYTETSCTAIFSIAIAKGIKLGILERGQYLPVISKAIDGLLSHSITQDGDVIGVCRGSGCKDDPEYYATLETITNDDHGTGVVLAALCELIELNET